MSGLSLWFNLDSSSDVLYKLVESVQETCGRIEGQLSVEEAKLNAMVRQFPNFSPDQKARIAEIRQDREAWVR